MSCFEYNCNLHESIVFCHHHLILYDATQSPHRLQSTWGVNCFDIVNKIIIIPEYFWLQKKKKIGKLGYKFFVRLLMFFWNGPFGFFSVFYFFQELIYLKESHFTSLFMLTSDLFDLFSLLMRLNTFIYTEIKDCCLYWSFFFLISPASL